MVGRADANALRWGKSCIVGRAIWLSKQGEGGERQVREASRAQITQSPVGCRRRTLDFIGSNVGAPEF